MAFRLHRKIMGVRFPHGVPFYFVSYCRVAQLGEQGTVNSKVAGAEPATAANLEYCSN